jgi:hypothetical protein
MPLSLCQAARETGRSKSVLSHALKTGRMSGRRDDKGNWAIDPAELFRVFDPKPAKEPTGEQSSPAQAALIELLREQVRDAKQREQELREEKNRLLAMLEGEQRSRRDLEVRLLTAPRKAKKKRDKDD